ncbi:MAG TPA: outer membrane beta-barrel protein [Lacibacter sp.]|nr:outer membrane beta-barrel protein [Lacibacter sp.]
MKLKLTFLSIVLLSSVITIAQNSSVFIKGGFNLANVSVKDDGSVDEAKALPSFHVGLQGDVPIVKNLLSLQPGLFFTGKGAKTQFGNTTDANYYRATSNPMYIEVPVNVVAKLPLGDKESKFFAGAGAYVAMGVAGKNKAEGRIFGVAFNNEESIKFSNDDPTTSGEEGAGFGIIRRFDYGLNGTIGFEGKSALFSVNYGLGLAKLQSGSNNNEDNNNKHRVLSFTVGFRL